MLKGSAPGTQTPPRTPPKTHGTPRKTPPRTPRKTPSRTPAHSPSQSSEGSNALAHFDTPKRAHYRQYSDRIRLVCDTIAGGKEQMPYPEFCRGKGKHTITDGNWHRVVGYARQCAAMQAFIVRIHDHAPLFGSPIMPSLIVLEVRTRGALQPL